MELKPVVTVKQGRLLGKIVENSRGGDYYSFQGIPYAKPPLAELRFKAPLPPLPWEGIRDATQEGNKCYCGDSLRGGAMRGSEDCLFLNVYTSELPASNTRMIEKPVMVWIHGGAFISGSCEVAVIGPDYLLNENTVVVTVTYRTGALGFTNFEDPSLDVPGNAGLKDMVMALKWVKENISVFGGNSNNVTIFGHSAGGAAVHLLTLSPMTKNLFHKAIAQSGSALNPWTWGRPSAPLFAEALDLVGLSEKEILKNLRSLPIKELFEVQLKIDDLILKSNEVRPFCPIIEKRADDSSFLSEHPLKIIKSGNYNQVPFIIGYTSREGIVISAEEAFKNSELFNSPIIENFIPYSFNLNKGNPKFKVVTEKIKKFYFEDKEPSRENMYLISTDVPFLNGIYETIRQQIKTSSSRIYLYRFSLEGRLNWMRKMANVSVPGAAHGDELPYIFKTCLSSEEAKPNSIEDITIRRICKLWTTFARKGDPNFKDEDLFDIEWKPVEKDRMHFLDIGENVTVGVNPERARIAFWDQIAESL